MAVPVESDVLGRGERAFRGELPEVAGLHASASCQRSFSNAAPALFFFFWPTVPGRETNDSLGQTSLSRSSRNPGEKPLGNTFQTLGPGSPFTSARWERLSGEADVNLSKGKLPASGEGLHEPCVRFSPIILLTAGGGE
jgi:hypothetical protein